MKKLFVLFIVLFIPLVGNARLIQPPLSDRIALPIIEPPKVVESVMYDIIFEEQSKKPDDIVGLIKYYAKQHGVNESLALSIAGCESGYRNIKSKYSSATGPFQQLQRFRPARASKYGRKGYSVRDVEANISVSIQMIKKEGTKHRNESKSCRGKLS